MYVRLPSSGAYALVGMAAFFAATAKAPTTSIIILFEMTNDYRIMLPLMAATVGSVYISHRSSPFSIYNATAAPARDTVPVRDRRRAAGREAGRSHVT